MNQPPENQPLANDAWSSPMQNPIVVFPGLGAICVLAVLFFWPSRPAIAQKHPIFLTPVSSKPSTRAALQVDVIDDNEVLGTAELYLTVQSSRSNADTRIILPINVRDFQGCRCRFIQLPFEVETGDSLLFNLLDDDNLTGNEEKLLVGACRLAGYSLIVGGSVYRPDLGSLLAPGTRSAADLLANSLVVHYRQNAFQNMGTAEFIVQQDRPSQPYKANKLMVVQPPNRARISIKVYYPAALDQKAEVHFKTADGQGFWDETIGNRLDVAVERPTRMGLHDGRTLADHRLVAWGSPPDSISTIFHAIRT